MEKQYTATCYILKDERVLLIYHKKFQKWSPPGGHVDPNETPQDAAVREVFEETGLHVQLISDEAPVCYPTAQGLVRPYRCLLENIPPYKETPAHQHIDFIFLAEVVGGTEQTNQTECEDMRWFSLDALADLKPGIDIFPEVVDILATLVYAQPQPFVK